jgi:predicted flap endonuclease-1-like 5' DNA nuclease
MSLLDTLKSLLGMERTDNRADADGDVGVTVEREAGDEPEPVSSPRSETGSAGDDASDDGGATAEEEPSAESEPAEADDGGEETAESEPSEADDGGEETAESEPAEADDGGEETVEGEPTDTLEGIGPAYADRLSAAGTDTVAQLAEADAEALAEETDIAQGRLETWIERADDR